MISERDINREVTWFDGLAKRRGTLRGFAKNGHAMVWTETKTWKTGERVEFEPVEKEKEK